MRRLMTVAVAFSLMLPLSALAAEQMPQSPLGQHAPAQKKYPKIVLYSTSWCPHCKAAKEFFTRNDIPFINRDVELDSEAMDLLTGKYKSQGVPVIVIGDDAQVLKGFDEGRVQKALDQFRKK